MDLSQNLAFCSVTAGKMPCVTPDGAKFLTQEVRFVTGVESLQHMGIYHDQEKLQVYTSASLQDLAECFLFSWPAAAGLATQAALTMIQNQSQSQLDTGSTL